MIVKSKTYKHENCFHKVINYLLKDSVKEEVSLLFTKFIKGKNLSANEISNQYIENSKHLKIRKGSVLLEMQILSFHPDNYNDLQDDRILKQIALAFILKHAPLALTTAVIHRKPQESKVHIHLAISRNNYKGLSSNRVSLETYQGTKVYMEKIQKEHFPFLKASEISHVPNGKAKITDREYKMEQKRSVCSEKMNLLNTLNQCYLKALSIKDFYLKLTDNGVELYSYRGKIVGLKTSCGLKHRFKKLGFPRQTLFLLNDKHRTQDRNAEINKVKERQEKLPPEWIR